MEKYVLRIYRHYNESRYLYDKFDYDNLDDVVACMKEHNAKADMYDMHFEYTINEKIKEPTLEPVSNVDDEE